MFEELKDFFRAALIRESIKVGDIFVYTGDDKRDPFNTDKPERVKVDAVKQGYVQYHNENYTTKLSNSIFIFRSMYKKT